MKATESILTVNIIVDSPIRAAARAASQPACPAPTTITSYFSSIKINSLSHTEIRENQRALKDARDYFRALRKTSVYEFAGLPEEECSGRGDEFRGSYIFGVF